MSLSNFLNKYDIKKWIPKRPENKSKDNNSKSGYDYIKKLLEHPITDGRHRIIWLIIAPYAVNILNLEFDEAYKLVKDYFDKCYELKPSDAGERIEYYINYALTTGLKPISFSSLKEKDLDLYNIISQVIGYGN